MSTKDADGSESSEETGRYKDPEWLWEKYHNEGLSTHEMAELTPVSHASVAYHMEKHGIDRREMPDAVLKAHSTDPVPFLHDKDGYEVWKHSRHGKNKYVRVHRLLAVAEFGFDAVCDVPVHHGPEANIPWANWPGNIELMEWDEHSIHHNTIPDGDLLDEMRRLADKLGRSPTPTDMNREGEYTQTPYIWHFGSWAKAKERAAV